jgi:hypothetical protein
VTETEIIPTTDTEEQTAPVETAPEQTAPVATAAAPEVVQHMTYTEAGMLAARAAMKSLGRPMATDWFTANSPDPHDPESIASSNRPMEFWAGFHAELMTVAGTA